MGGSSTPPPVVIDRKSDDTAMLKFLEQQKSQTLADQRAAQAAEQRALYKASSTAADQAAMASEQSARQMLGLQNQYQQAKDAQRMADYQKSMGMAGASITGGPFDVNAARQAQYSNLAAGVGTVVPMLPANFQDTAKMINPVNLLSANTENKSQSPSVKFGGS